MDTLSFSLNFATNHNFFFKYSHQIILKNRCDMKKQILNIENDRNNLQK